MKAKILSLLALSFLGAFSSQLSLAHGSAFTYQGRLEVAGSPANDTGITTVDADGVALAAIQGLNEKLETGRQKAEIQIGELKAENAELKGRLQKLEQLFAHSLNGGAK